MSEPLLELRGINKSFGAVQVLHDVDFKVHPGQVTALVGDNGAGKSTLVKVISGVYQPDTGEIQYAGRRVTVGGPSEAQRLGVATVFQDLALCDNLDVVGNLFLGQERLVGPILDEAEEAGVLMPSGCRMGICYQCVLPMREGSVRDLRTGEITTAAEGDGVKIQTCINAAAGDCRIEL